MNSFARTFAGLLIIYTIFITTVYSIDLHNTSVTKQELIALTRDHLGRTDPDALLNGFFPVWAAIQFLVACFFFIVTVLGTVCYFLGCRTPQETTDKQTT